ncbi:hypothetical protein GYN07_04775 [Rhizobium leguminosarum bv. viciae 248]|uniref:hypothetical protein n=1 Tax=Rhizobium leguminosarum TaxID=384 RepID=UPI00036DAEE7|nr:hypothetical protein [Rhizobium leguminosarum]MCA2407473.1 hypothetical protein [Rhizobium leguminosarum]NKM62728.1 hypothetical protein [Rhizobium leguminosarum bv. viciae]QHW23690.1 hypothetical protein GYN07_04775 [Rhizobium leguminosarum bv. viciae 248]
MIKQLVKAVLPQPVIVAAKEWHSRERRYWSWGHVSRAAGADYAEHDLTAFRVARSRQIVGNEESYAKPPEELLPAMDIPTGSFVDFGGSAGEMCAVLQRRFPSWVFTVVETKAMADASRSLRPSISYSDQLPDAFDVFYSSGTLQYLADPERLWRGALGRTARYAYLARNCFSHRKTFSVQSSRLFDNGAGPIPEGFDNVEIRYPHRSISESSLKAIAERMGFDLVARFDGRNSGVPSKSTDAYGADLLFKRR